MKIDLKLKIKNLKLSLFLASLLVFGYSLTRLINLTIIPVFCDEAIYIRWAQIMRSVPSLRFIPLSDGKQPLFMWLVMPFLKFISDPLVAGRMVSVLAGLGTMVGVGVLSYVLFEKKEIGLFASILYLVSPFVFFFDRMALADGLLSMFGIWFLVFVVLLQNKQRLDLAMLAGIILGLGLITKSPALFFALTLPLTIILSGRNKSRSYNFVKMVSLWGVVYLLAFSIYNILRLGPEFHMIAIRNKDYVYSLSEILKHPLSPLIDNLKSVIQWYWILLTPPIFILGLLGIWFTLKRNLKVGLFLLTWWLIPLLAQSAMAKVYTARYVLFTVPVFLLFSALTLEKFWREIKRGWLVVGGLVLFLLMPMYQLFLLIAAPQRAWLPVQERSGYLEMWTAGYGIKEASDYLKEMAKTQKLLVGTEGYFGTLPNGLEMYLEGVPNITVIGVGQPVTDISPKLKSGLSDSRVFLLVNDSRFRVEDANNLHLIAKYPKAINSQGAQENLLFFELR